MSGPDLGCGAPPQGGLPPSGVDLATQTVIAGTVRSGSGAALGGAYVRLLDPTGEFTAEVVTSPAGQFRFFAAPGRWTVRALTRSGHSTADVIADRGLTEVTVTVPG